MNPLNVVNSTGIAKEQKYNHTISPSVHSSYLRANSHLFNKLVSAGFVKPENGEITEKLKKIPLPLFSGEINTVLKKKFRLSAKYDFQSEVSIDEIVKWLSTEQSVCQIVGSGLWEFLGSEYITKCFAQLLEEDDINELKNLERYPPSDIDLRVCLNKAAKVNTLVQKLITEVAKKAVVDQDKVIKTWSLHTDSLHKNAPEKNDPHFTYKVVQNLAFHQMMNKPDFGLVTFGSKQQPLDVCFMTESNRKFIQWSNSGSYLLTNLESKAHIDLRLSMNWQALIDFVFKIVRYDQQMGKDLARLFPQLAKGYTYVNESDINKMKTEFLSDTYQMPKLIDKCFHEHCCNDADLQAAMLMNTLLFFEGDFDNKQISTIINQSKSVWSKSKLRLIKDFLNDPNHKRFRSELEYRVRIGMYSSEIESVAVVGNRISLRLHGGATPVYIQFVMKNDYAQTMEGTTSLLREVLSCSNVHFSGSDLISPLYDFWEKANGSLSSSEHNTAITLFLRLDRNTGLRCFEQVVKQKKISPKEVASRFETIFAETKEHIALLPILEGFDLDKNIDAITKSHPTSLAKFYQVASCSKEVHLKGVLKKALIKAKRWEEADRLEIDLEKEASEVLTRLAQDIKSNVDVNISSKFSLKILSLLKGVGELLSSKDLTALYQFLLKKNVEGAEKAYQSALPALLKGGQAPCIKEYLQHQVLTQNEEGIKDFCFKVEREKNSTFQQISSYVSLLKENFPEYALALLSGFSQKDSVSSVEFTRAFLSIGRASYSNLEKKTIESIAKKISEKGLKEFKPQHYPILIKLVEEIGEGTKPGEDLAEHACKIFSQFLQDHPSENLKNHTLIFSVLFEKKMHQELYSLFKNSIDMFYEGVGNSYLCSFLSLDGKELVNSQLDLATGSASKYISNTVLIKLLTHLRKHLCTKPGVVDLLKIAVPTTKDEYETFMFLYMTNACLLSVWDSKDMVHFANALFQHNLYREYIHLSHQEYKTLQTSKLFLSQLQRAFTEVNGEQYKEVFSVIAALDKREDEAIPLIVKRLYEAAFAKQDFETMRDVLLLNVTRYSEYDYTAPLFTFMKFENRFLDKINFFLKAYQSLNEYPSILKEQVNLCFQNLDSENAVSLSKSVSEIVGEREVFECMKRNLTHQPTQSIVEYIVNQLSLNTCYLSHSEKILLIDKGNQYQDKNLTLSLWDLVPSILEDCSREKEYDLKPLILMFEKMLLIKRSHVYKILSNPAFQALILDFDGPEYSLLQKTVQSLTAKETKVDDIQAVMNILCHNKETLYKLDKTIFVNTTKKVTHIYDMRAFNYIVQTIEFLDQKQEFEIVSEMLLHAIELSLRTENELQRPELLIKNLCRYLLSEEKVIRLLRLVNELKPAFSYTVVNAFSEIQLENSGCIENSDFDLVFRKLLSHYLNQSQKRTIELCNLVSSKNTLLKEELYLEAKFHLFSAEIDAFINQDICLSEQDFENYHNQSHELTQALEKNYYTLRTKALNKFVSLVVHYTIKTKNSAMFDDLFCKPLVGFEENIHKEQFKYLYESFIEIIPLGCSKVIKESQKQVNYEGCIILMKIFETLDFVIRKSCLQIPETRKAGFISSVEELVKTVLVFYRKDDEIIEKFMSKFISFFQIIRNFNIYQKDKKAFYRLEALVVGIDKSIKTEREAPSISTRGLKETIDQSHIKVQAIYEILSDLNSRSSLMHTDFSFYIIDKNIRSINQSHELINCYEYILEGIKALEISKMKFLENLYDLLHKYQVILDVKSTLNFYCKIFDQLPQENLLIHKLSGQEKTLRVNEYKGVTVNIMMHAFAQVFIYEKNADLFIDHIEKFVDECVQFALKEKNISSDILKINTENVHTKIVNFCTSNCSNTQYVAGAFNKMAVHSKIAQQILGLKENDERRKRYESVINTWVHLQMYLKVFE